jgi:hypothetical protein
MPDWGDLENIGGQVLGGVPGYVGSQLSQHGMGGTAGSVLFGGLGKSTNPMDYGVNSPNQAQMQAMMGQSAAQIDPAQQAQFRAMQLAQAQQLQRIASGQQQGAGELAAQRQVANAQAAQQAQARMARGGNAALAYRQAANNQAGIGLAGAGQAQQAALQDQSNAMGQLTGALGQGRGQDLSMAGQNAQFQNERYGQNLGALSSNDAQRLAAQQAAMGATLGQQGIAGGLLSTAGTMMAASDENLKTDITDADDEVNEMLRSIPGSRAYRYKNEARHGTGDRLGIMAQDLTKTPGGRKMVRQTPDGLAVDVGQMASVAIAKAAEYERRIAKLEKKAR